MFRGKINKFTIVFCYVHSLLATGATHSETVMVNHFGVKVFSYSLYEKTGGCTSFENFRPLA